MNGLTRLLLVASFTILFCGCDDAEPAAAPKATITQLAAAFDTSQTGTIRGQVRWTGTLPVVPAFHAPVTASGDAARGPMRDWPNPNVPAIDPASKGFGDVVVFLRGIDPARSRPWDLDSVGVEMADFNYRVVQGNTVARTGFVRRGEMVELVSHQSVFHSVRARGAAFFTLAFPDRDQPRQHLLDREGVVELSSAASYFWARAYLFVSDHPYLTRTDGEGNFTLSEVPAGDYEIAFWHPNWCREADPERDADSWQISRLTFRQPVEMHQKVHVGPGETVTAPAVFSANLFEQ